MTQKQATVTQNKRDVTNEGVTVSRAHALPKEGMSRCHAVTQQERDVTTDRDSDSHSLVGRDRHGLEPCAAHCPSGDCANCVDFGRFAPSASRPHFVHTEPWIRPMPQTPETNPMSPTAIAARSARSCAGVCGTGGNGSATGSPASPRNAARPQPIASTPMQRANGAKAIAEILATGDERDQLWERGILRVAAALLLLAMVVGLARGCAA